MFMPKNYTMLLDFVIFDLFLKGEKTKIGNNSMCVAFDPNRWTKKVLCQKINNNIFKTFSTLLSLARCLIGQWTNSTILLNFDESEGNKKKKNRVYKLEKCILVVVVVVVVLFEANQRITAENKSGTSPDNKVEIHIRTAYVIYFGGLGITLCWFACDRRRSKTDIKS